MTPIMIWLMMMEVVMQVNLKLNGHEYKAKLVKRAYSNGNVAIQAIDAEDGQPIAVLSTNTGDKVDKEYVAIKDYSENTGALSSLKEAGVVSDPEYFLKSGYVTIPVCKLLKEI